jgi:probable rRNA maturation factor
MIEVEVVGLAAGRRSQMGQQVGQRADRAPGRGGAREREQPALPDAAMVRRVCAAAAARAGMHDGHLAVEFVDAARMAALNAEHRDEPRATDVLSFPIDGAADPNEAAATAPRGKRLAAAAVALQGEQPERELGDVVICVEHTRDVREAIVHGVLHLAGFDHETDGGEMLALQREVLAELDDDRSQIGQHAAFPARASR